VGRTAAQQAQINGAHVNLLNLKPGKLDNFKDKNPWIKCNQYSEDYLRELLPQTDILIVAVHSLTKTYDIKISKEMVRLMEQGSVLMDISVEQTNAVESSHITNHEQPTFIVDGIVHYCVPNVAAIVPLTASRILTKKILPFIKSLALNGLKDAIVEESGLLPAISIYNGKMTNHFLAEYFGHEFYNIFELLELNL